ncbi:MAG: HPr family phosphocarrier protein [Candidatus Choladocola sp.]|nr:HPr family phosphocarrier protein [Candidatus Choladocola sp.]
MVSQKVTVINKSGIHARPASEFAKAAGSCRSDVAVMVGDRKINPKSVLNLMAAMIRCGTEIEVICEGATEEEDLKTLVALIESGLGE